MTSQEEQKLNDFAEKMEDLTGLPNAANTTRAILGLVDNAGYVTGMRLASEKSKRESLFDNMTEENLYRQIDGEIEAVNSILGGDLDKEIVRDRFMEAMSRAVLDLTLEVMQKDLFRNN